MSGGRYYVKNWSKFQHYQKRNPPWIKLHTELLLDRAFMMLAPCERDLLVLCWVLAAGSDDGSFTADPGEIGFRLRRDINDLKVLVDKGFLDIRGADASAVLADASAVLYRGEERRGETEERQSRDLPIGRLSETPAGVPDDPGADGDPVPDLGPEIQTVYAHYLRVMGLTPTAYRLTKKRRDKIRTRLTEFEPEALCQAIDACRASPWHMGEDPKTEGKAYNDLADHILRSEEKVEGWIRKAKTNGGCCTH